MEVFKIGKLKLKDRTKNPDPSPTASIGRTGLLPSSFDSRPQATLPHLAMNTSSLLLEAVSLRHGHFQRGFGGKNHGEIAAHFSYGHS